MEFCCKAAGLNDCVAVAVVYSGLCCSMWMGAAGIAVVQAAVVRQKVQLLQFAVALAIGVVVCAGCSCGL